MPKIEIIEDQEVWDDFITKHSPNSLLQSWAWGEFQKEYGRKVWRIGVVRGGKIIGAALAQLIPTKLRTHIYISNGPVFDIKDANLVLPTLIGYVKALGIQEKAKFVRMDPLFEDTRENRKIFKSYKLVQAKTHTQAEHKWLLNIEYSEDTLLAQMKKSTRYEIRKSEKEGVKVMSSTEQWAYDEFEKIFLQTVKRHKFIIHPISYYKTQFETLTQFGMYKVYLAQKGGETLAAALIASFGDSSAYLHAGSINNKEANKLMAPQALIWQAIKDSKIDGRKVFDFWGITNSEDPKDPWAGFSRFKKSFGGYQFNTLRGFDIPLSPQYTIISLLESTREMWGGIYKLFTAKK